MADKDVCRDMKHSDSLEGIEKTPDSLVAKWVFANMSQFDIIQKAGIVWKKPNNLESSMIKLNFTDTTHHNIILYQDSCFDFSWFTTQSIFLESLSDREIFILKTYTRNGDEVVNGFMKIRDKDKLIKFLMEKVEYLKTPHVDGTPRVNIFHPVKLDQITEKNVIQVTSNYADELIQIFKKAPPVTKPLRVFRGIMPPKYTDPSIYPLEGVTSTTYNPSNETLLNFIRVYNPLYEKDYLNVRLAREAQGKQMVKNCCIYDMILRPGVKAIWLEPISNFPSEQEIALLPSIVQASYSHPRMKLYQNAKTKLDYAVQVYDVTVNPIIGKTFSMKGGKTRRSKGKHRKTYRK